MGNQSGKQLVIAYTQEEEEEEVVGGGRRKEGNISELKMKQSQLTRFSLDLSYKNIISLSNRIETGSLRSINISHNKITSLPDTFDGFPNLFSLNISFNQISSLPKSIKALKSLIELKAEHNQFQEFPREIFELRSLEKLVLSHNSIKTIDQGIKKLVNLSNLTLHHNPIETLPTELNLLLFLKIVGLDGCPLLTDTQVIKRKEEEEKRQSKKRIPSLKELSSRVILKEKVFINHSTPLDVVNYLESSKACSFCNGPYFEHQVQRFRLMNKWGLQVPFVYNLCSSHFNNDRERVFGMFNPKKTNEISFIKKERNHDHLLRSRSSLLQNQSSSNKEMKKAFSDSFNHN